MRRPIRTPKASGQGQYLRGQRHLRGIKALVPQEPPAFHRTTTNTLVTTGFGRKSAARFSRKSPAAKKSGPRSLAPNVDRTSL